MNLEEIDTSSKVYFLIISCTLFITFGGYLINDYFDYDIDSVNKNQANRLDKPQLLQAYFAINFLGFGLSLGICFFINNYSYLLVYLSSISLLFLYASHLKQQGLIGNFVVSIFSTLVIAILWFVQIFFQFEVSAFQENLLIFFMIFIFLSSMARELIKDCEDIEGDKKFGLKTLPVRIGIEKTKIFVSLFIACLLLVCLCWLYWIYPYSTTAIKFSLIPIILLNSYILFKNSSAKTMDEFHSTSSSIKLLMGLGILSLYLISYQL